METYEAALAATAAAAAAAAAKMIKVNEIIVDPVEEEKPFLESLLFKILLGCAGAAVLVIFIMIIVCLCKCCKKNQVEAATTVKV